jgi:pyruvate/2-oxoacid:ferredoxin oxidoreductase beta subunit
MLSARGRQETLIFPRYEIEYGEKYSLNIKPEFYPVIEYLKLQGCFSHMTDSEIGVIQENLERAWKKLVRKTEA